MGQKVMDVEGKRERKRERTQLRDALCFRQRGHTRGCEQSTWRRRVIKDEVK